MEKDAISLPSLSPFHEGGESDPSSWRKEMERCGFSLLLSQSYVPLSDRIAQHARQLIEKERPLGHPSRSQPSLSPAAICLEPLHVQWWRHPAGVVCRLSARPSVPNQDVNMRVYAYELAGYGTLGALPKLFKRMEHAPTGEVLWATAGATLDQDIWTRLCSALQQGRLLPLRDWPPTNLGLVEKDSLDVPLQKVSLSEVETPQKRNLLREMRVLGQVARLLEPLRGVLDRAPSDERPMWKKCLSREAGTFALPSPAQFRLSVTNAKAIPSWFPSVKTMRQTYMDNARHARAGVVFNEMLEDFGFPKGERLPQAAQDMAARWLEAARAPVPPRDLKEMFSSSLEGLSLPFAYLLLALPDMPGALAKAFRWQVGQSTRDLEEQCTRPAPDGLTLPMRWARAWMHIHHTANSNISNNHSRHQKVVVAHAQRGLEHLAERVPVDRWVWESPTACLWDAVLYGKISTPHEDELIKAQAQAVESFVHWLEREGVPIPRNANVPCCGLLPLTSPDLLQAMERGYRQGTLVDRGSPESRLALLGGLVNKIRAFDMHEALEKAWPSAKAPVRRPARF